MSQAMVPAKQRVQTLRDLFDKSKSAIAQVVPTHLTPDRLLRITLAAVTRTPALLNCSNESILQGTMMAAQLGLDPTGGVLGEAYLLPYGQTAQLIPGYKGLCKLARQSGEVTKIQAKVVHENDFFEFEDGTGEYLTHRRDIRNDPGPMIAVYAIAKLKDGTPQFDVMSKAEVDKVRTRSRAANNGPWATDYDEMAKKTVIKRLAKTLPLSTEFAVALKLQDAAEMGQPVDYGEVIEMPALAEFVEGTKEPEPTRTESVKGKLAAKAPSGLITAEQKANLADAIEDCNAPDYVWSLVSAKFDAPTYEDVGAKQYDDVMKFIAEHRESISQ